MNYKKFIELTRQEKLELIAAHMLDGKVIEKLGVCSGEWIELDNPSWSPKTVYRVKVDGLKINWNDIASKYIALVKDRSGTAYLCTSIPRVDHDNGSWFGGREYARADAIASFVDSDINWRESLVLRS